MFVLQWKTCEDVWFGTSSFLFAIVDYRASENVIVKFLWISMIKRARDQTVLIRAIIDSAKISYLRANVWKPTNFLHNQLVSSDGGATASINRHIFVPSILRQKRVERMQDWFITVHSNTIDLDRLILHRLHWMKVKYRLVRAFDDRF